jgi:hypothetical protein
MFAILAEDESDADALSHIVKRNFNNDRLSIRKKGYDGCGALCRKGARDIKAWRAQGIKRFVVCHDADSNPPDDIREKVLSSIVRPSGAEKQCCITVPVQEIEAWLIADEQAISTVISSFRFSGHKRPETIQSPKEWLITQSKAANGKPLYSPKTFNAAVAKRLRFDVVQEKCPSFKAFVDCLNEKPDRQR